MWRLWLHIERALLGVAAAPENGRERRGPHSRDGEHPI